MRVEIYSDVVCPWCYIGVRRFQRALEVSGRGSEVEVVHRSYQLDPNTPSTPVPLKDYLRQRFGQAAGAMLARVSGIGAGEGIEFDWDHARAVNTFAAHRLIGWAGREYGPDVQTAVAEGLFDLHFTRGGDISDPDALAAVAEAAGVDGDRAREFLASDDGRTEVKADIARAHSLGIHAVPTFVLDGKYAVQGAQSVETFVRALEEVAARSENGARSAEEVACADDACEV